MLGELRKRASTLIVGVSAVALTAGAAGAATVSGEFNGETWIATSRIIGQTSTGTIATGGDPIYMPDAARHNGVVTLIMNYSAGSFICSGSLLGDRRSIVTAGHCVSGGGGVEDGDLLSTTAYFWDFNTQDPDAVAAFNPDAVAISVADYTVHSEYTGEVIDHNDIAVLTLSDYAPEYALDYDLYTLGDLTGEEFNVAGYGGRSNVGGALGTNLGTGRLRQGDNNYDFRLGDAAFGGVWETILGGTADYSYSYLSDFDNGLAANDTACRVTQAANFNGLGIGTTFCDTGLGATEVGIAGGDSGGPGFIDGKLASVNSYGLTFGTGFGDFNAGLNSSWGEFSGYVPIFLHEDFIRGAMVPEPTTWALMIGGFGLAGASLRRRRLAVAKA